MRFFGVCRRAALEALRSRSSVEKLTQQPINLLSNGNWRHPSGLRNGVDGFGLRGCQLLRHCSSASAFEDSEAFGPTEKSVMHVVSCEIEYLMKQCADIVSRKPPRPFVLATDDPEELEITLTRIYGLEDISMRCVLHVVSRHYMRKPEVGEDPEARRKMLQLTISITKGGRDPVLKIYCECYRDGFVVHQVDLESEVANESVFRPYFSDSRRKLVDNFQTFLYDRGLNADLAKYIENHLDKKRMLKSVKMWEKGEEFFVYPKSVRRKYTDEKATSEESATASEIVT